MTYREEFTIPNPLKPIKNVANSAGKGVTQTASTVGKGASNTASTIGKGVTGLPNTIKDKALSPIGNFFKNIWNKFKYFISVLCCLCILSCCFVLGIPQMAFRGISESARTT